MRLDYPDRPGNDWLFRGMSQVVTQKLLDAKGYHHGDWERPNDPPSGITAELQALTPIERAAAERLRRKENGERVTAIWEFQWHWKYSPLSLMTRGDVRRFCSALGIELKPLTEGAAP